MIDFSRNISKTKTVQHSQSAQRRQARLQPYIAHTQAALRPEPVRHINVRALGSPLALAIHEANPAKVSELLAAGQSANRRLPNGQTPLELALYLVQTAESPEKKHAHQQVVAQLYSQRADLSGIYHSTKRSAELAASLNAIQPRMGDQFLEFKMANNFKSLDKKRIESELNHLLQAGVSEQNLDRAIMSLTAAPIHQLNHENQSVGVVHFSHLNSWIGWVNFGHQDSVEAEGWYMDAYPPLKMRSMMQVMGAVHRNEIDAMREFGEPREAVLKKLKNEIYAQASLYVTQINQETIGRMYSQSQMLPLIHQEAKRYCERIRSLNPGEVFSISSGFPGHAVYMDIKRELDGSYSRLIYNLGTGQEAHSSDQTGRLYPHIVKNISADVFNPDGEGAAYLAGILRAKTGIEGNVLGALYRNAAGLGGETQRTGFKAPAQKRQLAGNCVLKNSNVATRNRLENDALFRFVKTEEKQFALEAAQLRTPAIKYKEMEKDKESVKEILLRWREGKNITAAVYNFNTFFDKRLKLRPDKQGAQGIDRLAELIDQNIQSPELKEWFKVKGTVETLRAIATTTNHPLLNLALDNLQPLPPEPDDPVFPFPFPFPIVPWNNQVVDQPMFAKGQHDH